MMFTDNFIPSRRGISSMGVDQVSPVIMWDPNITITINLYWLTIIFIIYTFLRTYLHRQMIKDVSDKYVLITGCDSGFGNRAAVRFSREGCHVIAGCLTQEGCEAVTREGRGVVAVRLDVTDIKSIESAYEKVKVIVPESVGLWGVVNNAGMSGKLGPIDWLSHDDVTKVIEVNVTGMIDVSRTFMPMLKKARGRLVNVASIVGSVNLPYNGVYSMTKHAVESLSDCMRMELEAFGVQVLIIEPGIHKTAFVNNIRTCVNAAWEQLPEDRKQEYGKEYLKSVLFLGCDLISAIGSSNIDQIVSAYHHALFSTNPKRRYMVGMDTKVLRYFHYMPGWLTDAIFRLPGMQAIPASIAKRP